MKKRMYLLFIICLLFTLVGCNDNTEKVCNITCTDVNITIGDQKTIEVTSDVSNANYEYSIDNNIITIKDGIIYANEAGECNVTVTINGYTGSNTFKVVVGEPGLQIKGNNTIVIKEPYELTLLKFGIDEDDKITWKSSNTDIIRVSKGIVTGVSFGKAKITATNGEYSDTIELEVIRPMITSIVSNDTINCDVNSNYSVDYDVLPEYASDEVTITSSNDNISVNEDNTLKANKIGTSVITLTSKANSEVIKEITVNILENKAPEFKTSSDYKEVLEYDYGIKINILDGIKAIDNADGDISDKITYDESKLYAYGTHAITLTITDKAGNVTTFDRMVTVNWQYHTKFIGHAGCLYGVANTEEAFLYAAKNLHYQAIECDVHSTKDGVFVTNHDSYFMDGDNKIVIAETKYEDLIKYELTYSKYTGHICSLERYLEICKEYGCEAIIELKWSTGIVPGDQSRMPALVKLVKDMGMWENTVFLTSMQECLTWFRKNNYNDIRLQYLVSGGDSTETLNFCKKYNIDLSVNVTYGDGISDDYLKRYHDVGLEVSTWTFSGAYSQVQEWIDKGVEYVTCDIHEMDKLELK